MHDDAMRYRYLRDRAINDMRAGPAVLVADADGVVHPQAPLLWGDQLDRSVDAQIASETPATGAKAGNAKS